MEKRKRITRSKDGIGETQFPFVSSHRSANASREVEEEKVDGGSALALARGEGDVASE